MSTWHDPTEISMETIGFCSWILTAKRVGCTCFAETDNGFGNALQIDDWGIERAATQVDSQQVPAATNG